MPTTTTDKTKKSKKDTAGKKKDKDVVIKKKITVKTNKPKNKGGRKGKYHKWLTPEGLLKIGGWAMDGLNDIQLAEKIGIHVGTYYEWANRFPEFHEAIKKTKDVADRQVENALFKSALGFKETLKKPMKVRQSCGTEIVVYVEEEIYYPPNTASLVFWLKNRKSETWRNDDRVVVENNEDAINIHQKTIAALQNRKVKGFNDSEGKGNG